MFDRETAIKFADKSLSPMVEERFELPGLIKTVLRNKPVEFGFNGFGEATYYRTYSAVKENGFNESWADSVIRIVEGTMSIRKDWYVKNNIKWDNAHWTNYAMDFANYVFSMKSTPPGRGLEMMGSNQVYLYGSAVLNNCAALSVKKLSTDVYWTMDMLLNGVGVGFSVDEYSDRLQLPSPITREYYVPDSREGWAESVKALIESYENGSPTLIFNYSLVRPAGAPIKTFGGVAPGPEPLLVCHETLRIVLDQYAKGMLSPVRIVADTMNIVARAVVSGGRRRSSQISLGSPNDTEFINLKNYELYPERQAWGWSSNNSIRLANHDDFLRLPDIAEGIRQNGEPGIINLINIQKYGRMTEEKEDKAYLVNPCGEIALENKELCCLSEVFANKITSEKDFYKAVEFATFYAHTVSLLPTHSPETNAVIERNHRTGVSISDIAPWMSREHPSTVIKYLRNGYKVVDEVNRHLAKEAGVKESVRKTTVKPSGTASQLPGAAPGVHYPLYSRYIRRMRIQEQSPIVPLLIEARVPHEPDVSSHNTLVFEFPVNLGKVKGQRDVSMWQKGAITQMMQRHWSDNAVSVTVSFNPETEGHQIEDFLALNVPNLKTLSMMPDGDTAAYAQMPYEYIEQGEYDKRKESIQPINWAALSGNVSEGEKFCNNDACIIG